MTSTWPQGGVHRCATLGWMIAFLLLWGVGCSGPESSILAHAAVGKGTREVNERPSGAENDRLRREDRPVDLDGEPHLVAWWKLDEVAGDVAEDSSRYGRDGTLSGALNFEDDSSPGRIGTALRFDGGVEFVEVSGYTGLCEAQARTVAAWVKTWDLDGEIVSWGCGGSGGKWGLRLTPSGFGVTVRGRYVAGGGTVRDGRWHHVAVVVEEVQPGGAGRVLLYCDGVPEEISSGSGGPVGPEDAQNVRIGLGFTGTLDDVRIYDRALSSVEVEGLFRAIPTASGVASYLRRLDQRARKLLTNGKAP